MEVSQLFHKICGKPQPWSGKKIQSQPKSRIRPAFYVWGCPHAPYSRCFEGANSEATSLTIVLRDLVYIFCVDVRTGRTLWGFGRARTMLGQCYNTGAFYYLFLSSSFSLSLSFPLSLFFSLFLNHRYTFVVGKAVSRKQKCKHDAFLIWQSTQHISFV